MSVYRLGAFVRVLPLFAAAAQFAACSSNSAAKSNPGGTQYAAVASPTEISPKPAAAAPARMVRAFPERALLAHQPPPPCELANPPADIRPDEAHVVTIDYERQCYRQFAEIVHARLTALQDAVARTRALGSRDGAMLQRESAPHCDAAKPPAGPPDARAAALDGERQCYRELAAGESAKLEALQDAVRKAADRSGAPGARHSQSLRSISY